MTSFKQAAVHLDIFLVLQQRRFHEVPQQEVIRLDVESVAGDSGDTIPVSLLHCLVRHQFQQWTRLSEVVDSPAKVFKRLPLFQRLRQLPTSDVTNVYNRVNVMGLQVGCFLYCFGVA